MFVNLLKAQIWNSFERVASYKNNNIKIITLRNPIVEIKRYISEG